MMRLTTHSLIAAVAYADVFDYPLTKAEVMRWTVGRSGNVSRMRGVESDGTYITLPGRKKIITLRKSRERFAVTKWKRAKEISRLFRYVPTVLLVGVTGGLAMDNAEEHDDIDLFFIVVPGALWISRLIVTLLAEAAGVRRHPGEHQVADKVCLNMFMTEDALTLPKHEQDLFSAHEVLQMVPLWERGQAYRRLLFHNTWVKDFLPAAWRAKTSIMIRPDAKRYGWIWQWLGGLEYLAKAIQLTYMESRRTNEVIAAGMIRFHPQDARVWVKKKFALRLKRLHIPLDKFFYHR